MPKLEQSEKYKDVAEPPILTRAAVFEDNDYVSRQDPGVITGLMTVEDFLAGDVEGGNYLSYNSTDGFEIYASDSGLRLDSTGLALLETTSTANYIYWKEGDFDTGDTIAYMLADWAGGAADDIGFSIYSYKATGMSAGYAVLGLHATDVDGGTSADITLISNADIRMDHRVFINETANTGMTIGLTINQGTNNDEALAIKSSDVGHGGYTTETDTYFTLSKVEDAAGGAMLRGWKDSAGVAGAAIACVGLLEENADTTKSNAGRGIVELAGYETSSGAIANTVADGNVVAVYTRRGDAYVCIAIIDEDGDLHLDGSNAGTFDEEDDALAAYSLAQGLAQNWNEGLRYNFDKLRELGVISGGDRDHPFISTKNLNALLMGAVGQLYERLERAGIA